MTYIRTEDLTPSKARELQHLGFFLILIQYLKTDKDRYRIYSK